MRIDAHQHFWRYDPAEYAWIGPDMAPLARDFLPVDLAPLLAQTGMDGTIAVQARQSVGETAWLLELASQYTFIKGVVGWLDLCKPDLEEQLGRYKLARLLRGLRHVVQDEPDDGFMLRSEFVRGIGMLAAFNLTYDILIFPRHLPVACKLVERFPNQRYVLDHIAKPLIRERVMQPWDADIRRLAAYPNVFCKVSGLVTEANWQAWQAVDFRSYLDVVFDAFGTARVMIGSDWPVCTVAGTYGQVMGLMTDYLAQFSPAERAAVLGGNAARFYQIGEL